MATMTAAEKRVQRLEELKAQVATAQPEELDAINAEIAELEVKIKADEAKAAKKTVNLDKEFKEAHKTFAVGIQETMRRLIREKE